MVQVQLVYLSVSRSQFVIMSNFILRRATCPMLRCSGWARRRFLSSFAGSTKLELARSSSSGKEMCLQEPRSLQELSCSTDVDDVLEIVGAFSMARRRHGTLFRGLQQGIEQNMSHWPGQALAEVVSDWRRTGYLREDFLMTVASHFNSNSNELSLASTILLLDGFASRRFYIRNTIDNLIGRASELMSEAPDHRLCEMASCLGRLELAPDSVVRHLVNRFSSTAANFDLTARDVTMLAYGMTKMNAMTPSVLQSIVRIVKGVNNFTASELSVMSVAVAHSADRDVPMIDMLARQAAAKAGQFSATHMALFLRSLAVIGFSAEAHPIMPRFICQLPRVMVSASQADVCVIIASIHKLGVRSQFLRTMSEYQAACAMLTEEERTSIMLTLRGLKRRAGVSISANQEANVAVQYLGEASH